MKLISSYLVIIFFSCSVENFASCAIIAGSNGANRSATDLYTINYDAVEAQVQISPLGKDIPSTILDLKQGFFLYINEGNICFVGAFSSKNQLEEPISDIDLYLSKILENVFGADELILYATEKVSNYDEIGTLRKILKRSCDANQIWRLRQTKPNLPTAEEFMRSRGMKKKKENAGAKLDGEDSDKEIRRIRRNAEVERRKFFISENRKKKTNKRRRRIRKFKQTNNIQNDDHFEGGVVIEDDIPYISPSFRRKDETGTFRHYLGFNDELEQDSYKTYSEVLPLPDNNMKSEIGDTNNENENWNEKFMNKESSEFQFPKTIVKNGQVFYRHDLNELGGEDAETDNHVSEEPQPVADTVNKIAPFQTFSNDAHRQISGSNKIAQRGFNLLLDQMRQIGSHTPITSAAIASAAVKGNSKGSTSHVIGAAMNNGYFAAAARGNDASGTLTQTHVQGSGRGSVGRATVVATNAHGKAFVHVDHNLGGSSDSYSVTQNGETNASAEIENRPNNLYEETIGQSYGEAGGNIYGSYDDKFDKVSSGEDQNVNKLGQILPGQVIKGTMVDNIIEEVYQPNILYPTYTQDANSQKSVFRDNYEDKGSDLKNGNLITGYTIIDKGGLLVGAGDPPRESEIQQINEGILPEGSLHLEEELSLEPKTEDFSINLPLKIESTIGNDNEFDNYSTEQINLDPSYNDSETKQPISIDAKFNFGKDQNSHGSAAANLPYTLETYSPHNAHDNTLQQLEDYHQSAHSFPSHLDVDYIDANQDRFPYKQTTSSSYHGKQNFSTKLSNEIASNIINGEENVAELHQAFLPYSPIETYAVPEPEPLPISPLAPKNYSAHFKTTIPKNVEPSETTYDYDTPYYPDYYEPNGRRPSPSEHPYSVKGSYDDNAYTPPSSNVGDNKYQTVPSFNQQIISDLMDKTIPPISKQKMVTPSTLILPIIVPENNLMESNDLLQPGEAGSMQTLEPVGPGEPKIKILTVENNDSTREFYQKEGIPIQPGEKIPGTPGYRVPQGFRGRVILGHRHPIEVASKRTVKGYNTQVNFQPQIPQTGAVFATVSGTLVPSPQNGNKTGVHITLSSHSTSRNRPRSLNPIINYSRSSQQLVGQSIPRKPLHSGKYDQTGDQGYSSRGRHSKAPRNGFQNKECGYFSNDCNKMQGPYQGATICLPIFIEAACCC